MESARCKAFMASAQAGSISKAAEILGYTPSGVSQLVSALETEFGFPLLIRGKRGVVPTEDGKIILEAIREYLIQEERIYQLASDINGLLIGDITIGAYPSIATHWLPAVISGFQKKHPNIHFHLMEGTRQELNKWLMDKKINLVFFSYQEPMDYEWIPIAEDPIIAVLPQNHPMANEDVFPLKQCGSEAFIMPALGRDTDVLDMLRRNGISPRINFSTQEGFSAISMIEEGLGIGIMNELITKNWKANVIKLPLQPPQSITLGIALFSLKKASPAVRRFVEFAVKMLGSA